MAGALRLRPMAPARNISFSDGPSLASDWCGHGVISSRDPRHRPSYRRWRDLVICALYVASVGSTGILHVPPGAHAGISIKRSSPPHSPRYTSALSKRAAFLSSAAPTRASFFNHASRVFRRWRSNFLIKLKQSEPLHGQCMIIGIDFDMHHVAWLDRFG